MARRKNKKKAGSPSPVSNPAAAQSLPPSVASRSRRALRRAGWGALAAALLVVGAVFILPALPPRTDEQARSRLAERRPSPSQVNLVVVTLDTLRADRLGCYGFRSIETPNIDAVAADGVLFEQATATAPMTLPSHASIFTGLIPPNHGVRDNGGFFLEADKTTLATRLKESGFTTGAFVAAWVLDSRWGLGQGFDHYSDRFDLSKYKVVNLGTVQKPGGEVMDDALAWLETVKQKRYFAWIHLYDPHTPYEPPEPYASRYKGQPYLGEVAYTDHQVGRLVSWLKAAGQWDNTILVLLADHGESLGEHGERTHTFFIYDATQHVPLIIRTPWGDRGRSDAQVSTVDLMPTLLDLVGLPPQEGIDGRSLVRSVLHPETEAPGLAYAETYFTRFHYGWQHLRSVRDGTWKYIEAPTPELYAIREDPGETRNVFKDHPRRAEELQQAIEKMAGSGALAAPDKATLDPETLQRLAALGYVGGGPQVDPTAVLPDPKDKIGLFGRIGEARALAKEDKHDEAIRKLQAVIAEDPGVIDAHITLGEWLRKQKRTEEAIAAFKRTLEIQTDNEQALIALAEIYRAQGRDEAAIEGFRSVLRIEPRSPQIWYQLATLYLDIGRVRDAEQTFGEALKHNPKMGAAYNSLAALAFSRGELAEAEQLVRRGLGLEEDLRSSRFNLARIVEARGDVKEAERLYREELSVYADHGKARFNLAQLIRQRGDRAGYLGELRAAIEKAPEFSPPYFFLAREELGAGRLDAAADLARRGLETDDRSPVAPLGHYVLADVFNRQGRHADANAEVAKARALEAKLRRNPPPVV
jgi:arylsulfatase A-like enzyme/cytochrome c-type biogenesis protein CcmH/NrfG